MLVAVGWEHRECEQLPAREPSADSDPSGSRVLLLQKTKVKINQQKGQAQTTITVPRT